MFRAILEGWLSPSRYMWAFSLFPLVARLFSRR